MKFKVNKLKYIYIDKRIIVHYREESFKVLKERLQIHILNKSFLGLS